MERESCSVWVLGRLSAWDGRTYFAARPDGGVADGEGRGSNLTTPPGHPITTTALRARLTGNAATRRNTTSGTVHTATEWAAGFWVLCVFRRHVCPPLYDLGWRHRRLGVAREDPGAPRVGPSQLVDIATVNRSAAAGRGPRLALMRYFETDDSKSVARTVLGTACETMSTSTLRASQAGPHGVHPAF